MAIGISFELLKVPARRSGGLGSNVPCMAERTDECDKSFTERAPGSVGRARSDLPGHDALTLGVLARWTPSEREPLVRGG